MGDFSLSLREDGEYSVSVELDLTIGGEVGGEGVTQVLHRLDTLDLMHAHHTQGIHRH